METNVLKDRQPILNLEQQAVQRGFTLAEGMNVTGDGPKLEWRKHLNGVRKSSKFSLRLE